MSTPMESDPYPFLPTFDYADYLTRLDSFKPSDIPWLWPNRIPLAKISLLVSRPGVGKSLLAADLASRISTGSPFPDGVPAPPRLRPLHLRRRRPHPNPPPSPPRPPRRPLQNPSPQLCPGFNTLRLLPRSHLQSPPPPPHRTRPRKPPRRLQTRRHRLPRLPPRLHRHHPRIHRPFHPLSPRSFGRTLRPRLPPHRPFK